jgi:hypothetical protein
MPETWEHGSGLDKNNVVDRNGDGWTNLEEHISGVAPGDQGASLVDRVPPLPRRNDVGSSG